MAEKAVPWDRTGLKWGLIFAAFLIVYGTLYRSAELDKIPGLIWIFYVAIPLGIYLALKEHRRRGGKPFRIKLALGTGAVFSILAAAPYGIYVYLYNVYVNDSLLHKVIADYRDYYAAEGLDGAALEQAMARVEASATPANFSVQITIMLLGVGLISTLILALVMKYAGKADDNTA